MCAGRCGCSEREIQYSVPRCRRNDAFGPRCITVRVPTAPRVNLNLDRDWHGLDGCRAIQVRHSCGKRERLTGFDGGNFRQESQRVALLQCAFAHTVCHVKYIRNGWARHWNRTDPPATNYPQAIDLVDAVESPDVIDLEVLAVGIWYRLSPDQGAAVYPSQRLVSLACAAENSLDCSFERVEAQ